MLRAPRRDAHGLKTGIDVRMTAAMTHLPGHLRPDVSFRRQLDEPLLKEKLGEADFAIHRARLSTLASIESVLRRKGLSCQWTTCDYLPFGYVTNAS